MNNAISLFSGIGGLDIGFAAAGFDIKAQVEIDPFCQRVLKRHAPEWWPNATVFPDVREFGRASVTGDIGIIFGGFPCQPHSVAGKRLGAEDDRNLWPQFRRIIGEFRPRAVLLENVPGILSGEGYAVTVVADLAALGYDCRWGTIRASDTGAPHKRERWFCVAYGQTTRQSSGIIPSRVETGVGNGDNYCCESLANANCSTSRMAQSRYCGQGRKFTHTRQPTMVQLENWQTCAKRNRAGCQILGNTQSTRLSKRWNGQIQDSCPARKASTIAANTRSQRPGSIGRNELASQSRMDRTVNGIPAWLDEPRWPAGQGNYQHQWEAPRTIGKGIDPHRSARIKALGNSVVPQIAYALACAIKET